MISMSIKYDSDDNLIVRDSIWGKWMQIFVSFLAIIAFGYGSFFLIKLEGINFMAIAFAFLSVFFIYVNYIFFTVRKTFVFFSDECRVRFSVKGTQKDGSKEYKYIHADIIKRDSATTAAPTYTFILFTDDGKYIDINLFGSKKQPSLIRDYCVEVLERTTDYKVPKETLELLSEQKGGLSGSIVEIARGMLRALR